MESLTSAAFAIMAIYSLCDLILSLTLMHNLSMKQTTLSQSRKRPAAKPLLQPGKRQSGLDGTSLRPIYLESEPADPTASTSNISESKESLSADEHDGPSTSLPLRVRNPTFDLGSLFTHVEAKAIKKDPDLDLLYFKKMSQSDAELAVASLNTYHPQ